MALSVRIDFISPLHLFPDTLSNNKNETKSISTILQFHKTKNMYVPSSSKQEPKSWIFCWISFKNIFRFKLRKKRPFNRDVFISTCFYSLTFCTYFFIFILNGLESQNPTNVEKAEKIDRHWIEMTTIKWLKLLQQRNRTNSHIHWNSFVRTHTGTWVCLSKEETK